jgi:hypothetical protein
MIDRIRQTAPTWAPLLGIAYLGIILSMAIAG